MTTLHYAILGIGAALLGYALATIVEWVRARRRRAVTRALYDAELGELAAPSYIPRPWRRHGTRT